MGNLWTRYFEHKDVKLLLLGLGGAGKTTLVCRLRQKKVMIQLPTEENDIKLDSTVKSGFIVEQLHYKNIKFTTWDIGGNDAMRQLIPHFYKSTDAVVIVIDGTDSEYLDKLDRDIIKPALDSEDLADSIFLFLVNKHDLPNCLSAKEVADKLNLKALKHSWHILEISADRGDGLTDSLDWLASRLCPSSKFL